MKAVFMDYTGTTVQESGPEIEEVVRRMCKNSSVKDPKKLLGIWWSRLRACEESSYHDTYLTEDEIVDKLLEGLQTDIQLEDNFDELHRLIQGFWVNAPLFPDVKEFYKQCPYLIYVISNNGIQYVERSMTEKGLSPAGIVCADMVRAYKPHRELFEKALEVSGCGADEVIHIGDSYTSDVQGAIAAGIKPILVQRKSEVVYPDTLCVRNLLEIDFCSL